MGKILIISNDLEMGGIQKSLIELLNFLAAKEFQIDLLLWQTDGLLISQIPDSVNLIERKYVKNWQEIKREKISFNKIVDLFNYLKFNYCAKILKKPWLYFPKISGSYDQVVSYCHNGFPRFFAIDKVKSDTKYLWYHHGSYDSNDKEYSLDKEYYAKFTKLITVSEANKTMLLNYFPELEPKISVVPNIINVSKILSLSKDQVCDIKKVLGVYNFVTVSRFSKEKGINLAIDIATELRNLDLQFKWHFIGEGETFSEIKKIVLERNLEHHCIFLGTKENPYPYIKLADLYIQTSLVESQSITIYEALSLKKMIVTTNLPALDDALKKGKYGILCEPEKISFANEIINLLNDDFTKDKLLRTLENHVVKNDTTFNKINELFKSRS